MIDAIGFKRYGLIKLPNTTVSYRVYIKKDYKPVVRWHTDQPWFIRYRPYLFGLGIICVSSLAYLNGDSLNTELPALQITSQQNFSKIERANYTRDIPVNELEDTRPEQLVDNQLAIEALVPERAVQWQTITVAKGENLSFIFDRLGLSPTILHQVISTSSDTKILTGLIPGDQIQFQIKAKELLALRYEQNLTTTLEVTKEDNRFHSEVIITELDRQIRESRGVINNSLFLAGLDAGLSDNLIMRFVSIYGWDIDFALNSRSGDQFKVIYEEQFKKGEKVGEGPILVSEFINRGKTYRAVRYTAPNGNIGYYNEKGYSMRKAFLRTPVKFNRVSSKFNLKRKHPVLNRIRAHKGVDYAAPSGTPIKSTGDGTIKFLGTNGGYGKSIVIRHGGIYNTVYAHMSRYAGGMERGKYIQQGDVIGYVGKTGLATGPHLHYEFRVNGAHHNPLTVKLPKALRIPEKHMAHFKKQTTPLLAQLEQVRNTNFALKQQGSKGKVAVALQKDPEPNISVH